MSVTIRSIDGKDLYIAETAADVRAALVEAAAKKAYLRGAYLGGADLGGAYLRGADLRGAYLRGADLGGAYLRGADLRGAYLRGADLRGADLRGAYLRGADLGGVKGFDPRRVNDLLILLDQPGPIRAYKLVDSQLRSPMQTSGKLTYAIGSAVEAPSADTDPNVECGAGINVATLPWVMREWSQGRRILLVEFTAADIAAIPLGDGKFRVRKVTVIRELDLVDLGLVPAPEPVAEPAAKPKRARKPKAQP